MSRWAHGTSPTNSRRKSPATSIPPARLLISALRSLAKGVSRALRKCSGKGMGQNASPASAAHRATSSRSGGVPMTPDTRSPSAMICAPVRVATSSTQSGSSSMARARASAMTRRPSASVLVTSTVVPSRIVTISLGRWASAVGMFSARASQASTRTPSSRRAAASTAPRTVAAPAMSDFISGMEAEGLRDRPPESKVIPLPISAMRCAGFSGTQETRTRKGGCTEPWPTPTMPPNPCSRRSASSRMSMSRPASSATARARWAKVCGVKRFGGSLTRSRARAVASARAMARASAALASAESARAVATTTRPSGALDAGTRPDQA